MVIFDLMSDGPIQQTLTETCPNRRRPNVFMLPLTGLFAFNKHCVGTVIC